MRAWKTWTALLLAAATLFYAMTALVYEEGGFGVDLVLKPRPEWLLAAGGGEEGAWRRDHPGRPEPWWLRGDHVVLLNGDREGGSPAWATAYGLGFLATAVAWVAALCWLVAWAFGAPPIERARGTAHSPAKRRE